MKKRTNAVAAKQKEKRRSKAPVRPAKQLTVLINGERVGGKVKVTASHDGRIVHWDTIDLDLALQRDRFVKGVFKRMRGVDAVALDVDLMKLPSTLPPLPEAELATESTPETPPPLVKVLLSYQPNQDPNNGTLTAELDGATVHLDTLDPLKATRRRQFVKELTKNSATWTPPSRKPN
jgi:hypothetical protein